jgi:hypothetical protein
LKETAWLKMLKPYGYHDNHEVGEIIPVDDLEDIDFFITNGIAEIVDLEAENHIVEDKEFVKYGVEKDEEVWVVADVPIHLGTNVANWKK